MSIGILWVTSFAKDMSHSGERLIESFRRCQPVGHLLVAHEGGWDGGPGIQAVLRHDLDGDKFLQDWLLSNREWIPAHLGGTHPGCQCKGGPFDPHSKRHKLPCVGYWFCRNASRWFRKVAALRCALRFDPDAIVWVDADCRFLKSVHARDLASWFGRADVLYFKNKRPVAETGIVGYRTSGTHKGGLVIRRIIETYSTGEYRKLQRWDDSYVTQKAILSSAVKAVDLAEKVGDNSRVIDHSVVGQFITHDKGHHNRTKVMT